ncbi:MAG: DUF2336 domain-containing protein [Bauldia sp.]
MTVDLRQSATLASSSRSRDAALLRATAEHFAHEPPHERDERQRFEELVLHFLPRVPIADRAFVAEAIAERADAPVAVLRALARDVIEVARPVLAKSPSLGAVDLLTVIAGTGALHHSLIARRRNLPAEVAKALRLTGNAEVITLLEAHAAPSEPARPASPSATATAPAAAAPASASPAAPSAAANVEVEEFLALERGSRMAVLAGLAELGTPGWKPRHGPLEWVVENAFLGARLLDHAKKGDRAALTATIAGGTGLDSALVTRLLADPSGEPFVLLLRTLGLSSADAGQVMLLGNPAIGRSVPDFFHLHDLYCCLEARVAETLVARWRGDEPKSTRTHQPFAAPAERNAARRLAATWRDTSQDRAKEAPLAPAATGTGGKR